MLINPNHVKIFSHLIHAGGGVIYDPPPLYPVIAVIKGQTKKQMVKFCKKTNFEQFFNGTNRVKTSFSLQNIDFYLCGQVGNTKWILCSQKN